MVSAKQDISTNRVFFLSLMLVIIKHFWDFLGIRHGILNGFYQFLYLFSKTMSLIIDVRLIKKQ